MCGEYMKKVLVILCVFFASYAQAALVSVESVTDGEILPVNKYVGTVVYRNASMVAAERSGIIDNYFFDDGDYVQSGAALVNINKDVLAYNIAAMKLEITREKLTLEKLERDYKRTEALHLDNVTTRQNYLDSFTNFLVQQEVYQDSLIQMKILEEELKRSSVKAPFAGLITKRYVNRGEWVSAGTTVYEVVNTPEISVNIPQAVISSVVKGQEVVVTIEKQRYQGKVRAVMPAGDNVSRTFPIKIELVKPGNLLGGMDATVELLVGESQKATLVPISSIVQRNGIDVVFVPVDGRAVAVPVKVVGYQGIYAGVETPEKINMVVTTGNERLVAGENVEIAK